MPDFSGWPKRLLHVPTWTSCKRTQGNIYGIHKEPAYHIISYTWGRWEDKNGEALAVDGLTWTVPPISPQHFSASEFRHLIKTVAAGIGYAQAVEYVWIDVFCIDQENPAIKAEEIGRQALIFKRATKAYIWFLSFSALELEATLTNLLEVNSEISNRVNAIDRVLLDPWCSSLWTLQEAFLRSDATLLSRDAEPVFVWEESDGETVGEIYFKSTHGTHNLDDPKRFIRFATDLSTFMDGVAVVFHQQHLSAYVPRYLAHIDPEMLQDHYSRIKRAGFQALDHRGNPFLVYTTAISRRAGEALDRIYAIMQIYELQLGASDDSHEPEKDFSLLQLENQLVDGFLSISPFYSQFFVHTKPAPKGLSWRINENSAACSISVSHDLMPYNVTKSRDQQKLMEGLCLRRDPERGHLAWMGQRCGLVEMAKYWASALENAHLYTPILNFPHVFTLSIQLDVLSDDLIPASLRSLLPVTAMDLVKLMDCLGENFDISRLFIFKLGRVPLLMGATDERMISAWAGVLAYELEKDFEGDPSFRRLGICVWDLHYFQADVHIQEVIWVDFQGRME